MNRPPIFAAIILLIAASISQAQSVTFPEGNDIKAEKNEFIILVPKIDGGAAKWRIGPGLIDDTAKIETLFGVPSKGKMLHGKIEGKHKVEVWCAKANVASDITIVWITIGPAPDPVPDPTPDPPPAPVVTGKVAYVSFVNFAPTDRTNLVTEDLAFRVWIKVTNNLSLYGVTSKSELDALPKFVAAKVTSPSIVLQDAKGNVIAVAPIIDLATSKAFISLYLGK